MLSLEVQSGYLGIGLPEVFEITIHQVLNFLFEAKHKSPELTAALV